ncbi:hypothetical protein KC947_01090 [Candidatus Saccharibacteria bacterium]|nr:hypothetical protein [Candidatus Saccharibacteria bacterium]
MSEFSGQSCEHEAFIPDFQRKIDAITSRSLTPENINTYADEALDDLVGTVQEITALYDRQPTISFEGGAEHEQAAFAYFGLNATDIEATLDHIADKATEIRSLDSLMQHIAVKTDMIITPSNTSDTVLSAGSGSFSESRYVPRLKTLLFVLSNSFDIELSNPSQCLVLTGAVSDYMMRNEPYNLVSLPTLNREVLVCDEEGNATFIFDKQTLEKASITHDRLITMDKDAIGTFLDSNPGAGHRLPYSKSFTERIASLLESIPGDGSEIAVSTRSAKFLELKEIPDDLKTRNATAKELDISHNAVKKAVDALGTELGEITMAKFKNGPAAVYSPEQRQAIRQWLDSQGFLAPKRPDGYLTLNSLADEFSVSFHTVKRAIKELGDELGGGMRVRIVGNYANAYSPEQQQILREYFVKNNVLVDGDHGGYLSRKAVAKELGTSEQSVTQAIEDCSGDIGTIHKIKVGPRVAEGYSPAQQQIIREYLTSRGILATAPPEGFFTKRQFAEQSGYSSHAVDKALLSLKDSLGAPLIARVGTTNKRPLGVYSPGQQGAIIEWLRENGYRPTKSVVGKLAVESME